MGEKILTLLAGPHKDLPQWERLAFHLSENFSEVIYMKTPLLFSATPNVCWGALQLTYYPFWFSLLTCLF